jgi:SAM-dependent methyltransferase
MPPHPARPARGFGPIGAAAYDVLAAPLERRTLSAARQRLLTGAAGRVLEVGAGTGANLPWYPAAVDHVDLCEPDRHMRRRLERRVARGSWPFTVGVHDATAEGPFPGTDYDVIVATLVLCSVPDPAAAAAALRAALAGDGTLRFFEHVHVGGLLGRLQSAATPLWSRLAGGCHLDRPATAAIRRAGLVPVEQRWVRLPPPLGLGIECRAVIRVRPDTPAPVA